MHRHAFVEEVVPPDLLTRGVLGKGNWTVRFRYFDADGRRVFEPFGCFGMKMQL